MRSGKRNVFIPPGRRTLVQHVVRGQPVDRGVAVAQDSIDVLAPARHLDFSEDVAGRVALEVEAGKHLRLVALDVQ